MGSYNCLVDLIAHKHLGGKTLLYLTDLLYVAVSQNERVIKYQSFGDHWCSSLLASQDPVAIDSVGLDFIRNEPRASDVPRQAGELSARSGAGRKAAFRDGVRSRPEDREPVTSLGVHEHWNNPSDKQYSRNLGKREGIELVKA